MDFQDLVGKALIGVWHQQCATGELTTTVISD